MRRGQTLCPPLPTCLSVTPHRCVCVCACDVLTPAAKLNPEPFLLSLRWGLFPGCFYPHRKQFHPAPAGECSKAQCNCPLIVGRGRGDTWHSLPVIWQVGLYQDYFTVVLGGKGGSESCHQSETRACFTVHHVHVTSSIAFVWLLGCLFNSYVCFLWNGAEWESQQVKISLFIFCFISQMLLWNHI